MTRRFGRPAVRSSQEDRTYDGRVYASKMERLYAEHLDGLKEIGRVFRWVPQPVFKLTVDITFRPDFLVAEHCAMQDGPLPLEDIYVVDVKGGNQAGWTKKRKLWLKYGPVRLIVVTKKSPGRWTTTEVIDPATVEGEKCS